jgi:hypothetical protein
MPATRQASQILAVEIIGFLVIIALSWANELLGLPLDRIATRATG